MTTLVWFRNDLRVADNPALYDACEKAGNAGIIGVYLVSQEQSRLHDEGTCRLAFLHETLIELRDSLSRLGIPLWIARAPLFEDAPGALMEIARSCAAKALYFNGEYPLNEARRDRQVVQACDDNRINCQIRHGDLMMPPGSILTADGKPYSVFTPFKRRWLDRASSGALTSLPEPRVPPPDVTHEVPDPEPLTDLPAIRPDPDWPAGESAALRRLERFLNERIDRYGHERDFPDKPATSRLSAYLSNGSISVRTCYERAAASASADTAMPWLNELIWREFYRHVVSLHPHVSQGRSFKRDLDLRPWRNDPEALDAWQKGLTGYPLVDAGMRQLSQTGFMHNRLRMVTAMFLTKHLLIHWREGERHFMQHLRDGDFASNNGGWQWSASTGTDSAPYFRIFNPASQAKKFDPDSSFVRRFVPEFDTDQYPQPMVEHAAARQRALDFFKAG